MPVIFDLSGMNGGFVQIIINISEKRNVRTIDSRMTFDPVL